MKVFVGDIKTGMRLSEDVKGANGRFLLAAGTVIEEQHLRIFNIWGVSEVDVDSAGAEQDEELDPVILQIAGEYVDGLYAHADMTVPPMSLLRDVSLKHFAGELEKNNDLPQIISTGVLPEMPEAPLYPNVGAFLKNGISFVSFPDIYYKIVEALDDPGTTSESLADIISKDSGLSAKLISVVNSPLYGFSLPVESLSRAVSLVGTSGVCQLALSVSVMEAFKGGGNSLLSMASFWKHSLACAVFCRILAAQIPGVSQDKCFVAGMLHDIGLLILLEQYPVQVELTFVLSRELGLTCCEAESRVFGFDHCELAKEIFGLWNIPPSLTAAVAGHHGGELNEFCIESAICSVADSMALAMQYGADGLGFVNTPYHGAWDALGLPDGAVVTTILKANRQIADILAIFGG
ncbi:HDOD domain-containing protein [Desulfovibrio sp. JC010]|uniref:HDOD domain-containing protein n=1 Tax=Desulfovibrio sp. JC010 TaxID=2593641 RepID=UPI0013D627C7|nr:HDOD domain-containing protein [Desulfovibrio sp. JC010]NDV26783.1 HDOD domain-containing protein [Desulfovibrio sp. JC010]